MREEFQSSNLIQDHTLSMESSSRDISSHSSRHLNNLEDRKWASYLHDDAEEKAKINIKTRMKAIEDSEKKLRKEAYERGISAWKTAKIPNVERHAKPESNPEIVLKSNKSIKKEIEVSVREFQEASENIEKNINKSSESKKRKDGPEHEEDAKKRREHKPLEYFWKPDPLFYLHLTQLGYTRIAVEKALYCTDNKSVELAEKYIQEHPNLTPLTKEEVLADVEAFLNEIRPRSCEDEDSSGNEIKIDSSSQRMQFETEEGSSQEKKIEVSKEEEEELSPHLKEKIKTNNETDPAVEVELLCVINTDTALNAATVAIECSRATIKIMEELQNDKWRKLREDWTKYGKCANAYQTDGTLHLYQLQEKLLLNGNLSYLAEIQNPLSPDSALPVVLCILCNTHYIRKNYPMLSKVN